MTLLVDFLCRFGWGLALGLVCTPAGLVPAGFFRVNLLVVMGLATFAALLAGSCLPGNAWLVPAAAAAISWIGTILWLAQRKLAGKIACALAGGLLAAATWMAGPVALPGAVGGALAVTARHLLSGAVVGLSVHAMLLGHWYLNAPGMRIDALRRAIDVALVAWGLQLALCTADMLAAGGVAHLAATWGAAGHSASGAAMTSLRWLAGLVGLPILLWMSRKTLEIPNTQSATGILYVACLASIVGELAGQLLDASG
ncbi:MAG: hypothetical protein DWH79_07060 [Planctomycetota bacterium]|nr:MAG: hypothetical protein DWH79_07060 [Planctomycetota bacterium]